MNRSYSTFSRIFILLNAVLCLMFVITQTGQAEEMANVDFFEKRIRPMLVKHCYECHSEQEKEQMGGLLLDRQSGWLKGGETTMAVIPGEPQSSLLMEAILYKNENLQMPPEGKLSDVEIKYFEDWIQRGAPGPENDLGDSEFSQLGDQEFLFEQAKQHWAFQPIAKTTPLQVDNAMFNRQPIDQFIFAKMQQQKLTPSRHADPRSMLRRLSYDLTGLPPTAKDVEAFPAKLRENRPQAIQETVDRLIESPAFGEKMARMWLDIARYADTDSRYRPDTKTPHYFPFAFTYRDYVIKAFNADKPFNQFVKEQLAADLMGFAEDAPEQAALGFLAVGPHAGGSTQEEIDDWIDVTSRGLLGLTVACARCHDHKYEPIPTADYYALHGVFNSVDRANPLNEKLQPEVQGYTTDEKSHQDYLKQRQAIAKKIEAAGNKKAGGNNRSIAQKIRETELAALLTYHPAAPARAMVVAEKKKPIEPSIFIRGDASNRGDAVPRRFLKLLDDSQTPFSDKNSGRLELAGKITSPDNPLTTRVFVNRVWGMLMGSYLVDAPSNFGLMTA
ncbi:PSD1 and planctomycete cytochrome C domain-containing protein, partial [bacterium]|nr:PSD1 and planctomycete cytochrome C domain-containing protein [bacterium]